MTIPPTTSSGNARSRQLLIFVFFSLRFVVRIARLENKKTTELGAGRCPFHPKPFTKKQPTPVQLAHQLVHLEDLLGLCVQQVRQSTRAALPSEPPCCPSEGVRVRAPQVRAAVSESEETEPDSSEADLSSSNDNSLPAPEVGEADLSSSIDSLLAPEDGEADLSSSIDSLPAFEDNKPNQLDPNTSGSELLEQSVDPNSQPSDSEENFDTTSSSEIEEEANPLDFSSGEAELLEEAAHHNSQPPDSEEDSETTNSSENALKKHRGRLGTSKETMLQ